MRRHPRFVVSLAVLVSCTRPGPRAEGRGEAAWGGDTPATWAGPCVYEVQTRWATSLPHLIRLRSGDSEWSIEVAGPRSFPVGRNTLSPTGQGGIQGLVLEGATVRGAIQGTLQVERRSDSTFIDIVGTKAYRDTVQLEAACRLGRIP